MTSTQTRQGGRRAVWTAGLAVAGGAGAATAHGLCQVAAAARVPTPIGWLYPLITDGLALVGYAATSRLDDGGRRYAAGIVVLAAGLSGLAQAVYLAGGIAQHTTPPAGLRFGVGAWPAIAAALTAHLLHLIGTAPAADHPTALTRTDQPATPASNRSAVQPFNSYGAQSYNASAVQAERPTSTPPTRTADRNGGRSGTSGSASERARQAARIYHARHGRLPTATELMRLAQVARGTAGTVLKELRADRPALHLVDVDIDTGPDL